MTTAIQRAVKSSFIFGLVLISGLAQARDQDTLTIYSTAQPGAVPAYLYQPGFQNTSGWGYQQYAQQIPGYAVVKHERTVELPRGRSNLRFTDVAALIDPTTVQFSSLTDPDGTRVIEQDFQFDLIDANKLLQKYIDKKITLDVGPSEKRESFTGTLLSTQGGLILKDDQGQIHYLREYGNIRYPELPGGLITRPTLVWDIAAEQAGKQQARVTYQTSGITWWTDYNLVFSEGANENEGKLDVGAWVSIINQSGASYRDARLKLIAGDVHRASPPSEYRSMDRMEMNMVAKASEAPGFEEKSFFEFHLYTLGRTTTLPDQSTKQVELFPAAVGVPAEKVLLYYGLGDPYLTFYGAAQTDRNYGVQSNSKVDVYLKFKNDKKYGLGVPLPAGRIRVSKLDTADQGLEFIGEDVINHTPKDEDVLIKLGSAFDVVGERRQVDFKVDYDKHWIDETVEIKLRNHKEAPVKVIAKENLYRWVNWKITKSSHEYEKIDSRTVHFPVTVAKDGEAVVTYTVHYSW